MYGTSGISEIAVVAFSILTATASSLAQGLLIDQASGTLGEFVPNSVIIPLTPTVQSFTPSFSAVGFVQLSSYITNGTAKTVVINLRQDAYNGPIVSSTTPVVLVNKLIEISTFYFPENIPVTPNQVYYFEPLVLSGGTWFIGYKGPSTYDRGELFGNGTPSGGVVDLWFQEGIVVPEPGAVWLALLGAGVLVFCRRFGQPC